MIVLPPIKACRIDFITLLSPPTRFEILMDEKGLVPLEYQESMRTHQAALKRLDAAMAGQTPGWTADQAEEARRLVEAAHQAFMETCRRVAGLPAEERRELAKQAAAELSSFDKVNRVIVEVFGCMLYFIRLRKYNLDLLSTLCIISLQYL